MTAENESNLVIFILGVLLGLALALASSGFYACGAMELCKGGKIETRCVERPQP